MLSVHQFVDRQELIFLLQDKALYDRQEAVASYSEFKCCREPGYEANYQGDDKASIETSACDVRSGIDAVDRGQTCNSVKCGAGKVMVNTYPL